MVRVEQTYVKEMNILKGIGILLVVLGHSFPDGVGSENYRFLHQLIYSFHMPLFFLISGFFAKRVYEVTNFQEYSFLVKDKLKRLIVPYFILSFVAIPLKLIMNRYALRPIDLNSLISDVVLYPLDNPIIFFWFIYTLFMIFLLAPLLSKLPQSSLIVILLVWNLMPMNYIRIFNLSGLTNYSLYFFAGIIFSRNYKWFKELPYKPLISLSCFLILLALNLFVQSSHEFIANILNLTEAFAGIVCFLNLSYLIQDKRILGNALEYLGKFSFDIYLLSWFFQTGSRIFFYQIIKLDYNLVVLLMFLTGILAPIIVSKFIIRKIGITNKFILGNFTKSRPLEPQNSSLPF